MARTCTACSQLPRLAEKHAPVAHTHQQLDQQKGALSHKAQCRCSLLWLPLITHPFANSYQKSSELDKPLNTNNMVECTLPPQASPPTATLCTWVAFRPSWPAMHRSQILDHLTASVHPGFPKAIRRC
jgi:hypothetical protein